MRDAKRIMRRMRMIWYTVVTVEPLRSVPAALMPIKMICAPTHSAMCFLAALCLAGEHGSTRQGGDQAQLAMQIALPEQQPRSSACVLSIYQLSTPA